MGEPGVLSELEKTVGGIMIVKIADNILSPLGLTTDENFNSILAGESKLAVHQNVFGLPEAFCGSLFDRERLSKILAESITDSADLSFLEQLCVYSALQALENTGINPANPDVIFVISTTKGNVEYLSEDRMDKRSYLAYSANRISRYFANPNKPLVVSNACISGVCAQIAAVRELLSGRYRYAIVIGCDVLSKFIVSGFQSFKALSGEKCKPYDKNRSGLNLGEAAGTIILQSTENPIFESWQYVGSSIHNDANHISGPSRTGEGSYRVLTDILKSIDKSSLAFVNAHGTATAYNDEMESIAIHRVGLDDVPINGLKGVYGHTLGAAGIIETILSMKAIDNSVVMPTRGYEEQGTFYALNISNQKKETEKKAFIKILSGFGGSNAGIAYRKGGIG